MPSHARTSLSSPPRHRLLLILVLTAFASALAWNLSSHHQIPRAGWDESTHLQLPAARMLTGLRVGQPMSALARQFEPVPQLLENVRFSGGKPLESEQVKAVIADGEQKLNGSGRIVVRASGTEPLIRIMAEGDDARLVDQVVKDIAGAVKKAAA